MLFKKSQENLVITPILLIIILTTLLAQLSYANKTAAITGSSDVQTNPPQQQPPLSILTTPSTGTDDEPNGDDGTLLKKDLNTIEQAEKMNNKTNQLDNHQFYKPEYINKDPERAMSFWVDFSKLSLSQNSTKHEMLSNSHRRAAPIKLSFDFPFYGQPLRNVIIATGGFLYVGEHLHHWLAATQNISPLMANFDLSTSNSSDIHYYDNGTSLVVQWQNVQMKDNKPPGNFSFQVTLHKNGDIIFVYKSLPVSINEIPEDDHPVKVGISDAFLIDKVAFFIRRKTIYDYHRLNLRDNAEIGNKTAVYLKALPTCNQFDSCTTCSQAPAHLECMWCQAVKRCSNGFDRKRQEWLTNNCEKVTKFDCSAKSETNIDQYSKQATSSHSNNQMISVDSSSNSRQLGMSSERIAPESRTAEGGTAFVTLLMFMALSSGVALWVFYAYKNPHTPSGQMLIKYRPSNWRWQNAETRYTAASIHM